jgi:RNA polymerase sigma-70 factor (ECF subfamily)
MDEETLHRLDKRLHDLRAGDKDAADQVVMLALSSFRQLARSLLRGKFSRLKGHDTDSVLNTAWPQLVCHFRAAPPESVATLLRVTCKIIQNDLIEIARQERFRFRNALPLDGSVECASATPDAEELASWADFHDAVIRLPDDERTVFEFNYYLGMKQAQIASLLDTHPKEVSRRYIRARGKLADWMEEKGFLV